MSCNFVCDRAKKSQESGNYQQALRDYDLALKINPNLDTIWSERGTILSELGRDLEAIISYHKAMKILTHTVS